MPVRNMLYDALSYSKQIDELSRKHIEDKDYGAGADDFLSGIHKGDRLRPVVTLVMYWTPEAWDGPMSIHQMLEDCDAKLFRSYTGLQDKSFDAAWEFRMLILVNLGRNLGLHYSLLRHRRIRIN